MPAVVTPNPLAATMPTPAFVPPGAKVPATAPRPDFVPPTAGTDISGRSVPVANPLQRVPPGALADVPLASEPGAPSAAGAPSESTIRSGARIVTNCVETVVLLVSKMSSGIIGIKGYCPRNSFLKSYYPNTPTSKQLNYSPTIRLFLKP